MRSTLGRTAIAVAVAVAAAQLALSAAASASGRVATFNASLNRNADGDLVRDLWTPNNAQAAAVAEVIQRVRPDVLLRHRRRSELRPARW